MTNSATLVCIFSCILLIGCLPRKSSSSNFSKLSGSWQSSCVISSKLDSSSQDSYTIDKNTITWWKVGYTGLDCAGGKEYQYRILISYEHQVVPGAVPERLNIEMTMGESFFTPLSSGGIDVGKAIDSSKTWVMKGEQEFSNSNFESGKKLYDFGEVESDKLCLGQTDDSHDKTSPEKRPIIRSQECLTKLLAKNPSL